MPGKPCLDMTLFVQVQVKVNGGGLDVVMTQMVLNFGDGMAAIEHGHCLAMAKAMDRIDVLEALWRKSLFQILSADAVNAMSSKFFPPLTDK